VGLFDNVPIGFVTTLLHHKTLVSIPIVGVI